MIIYEENKDCYGCNSCFNICFKNVINMVKYEKLFKYLKIDYKCINCNLCIEIYPLKEKCNMIEGDYNKD